VKINGWLKKPQRPLQQQLQCGRNSYPAGCRWRNADVAFFAEIFGRMGNGDPLVSASRPKVAATRARRRLLWARSRH
jgi:hypothetical protein